MDVRRGSAKEMAGTATALPLGATGVVRIWPGDVAPGSETWDWQERTAPVLTGPPGRTYVRNVVVPTVTVFAPAEGRANGAAMVIAPGGAFHFLMMEHEGYALARRLAAQGVTAFVLKYRLARTPDDDTEMDAFRAELGPRLGRAGQTDVDPPVREFLKPNRLLAEEDGRQAIRWVRAEAQRFGLDPARIGIAGFSAGGGVAMGAAFEHDAASRPDFVAALYPAYRAGVPVPENPPPLFLVIADDDASIPPISSARLYEAWHKAGGRAELHIFGSGAHGFGMDEKGTLSDAWAGLFENWLRARGIIAA